VDAILALAVPTAVADLVSTASSAWMPKPLALTLLGQAEGVRLLPSRPEKRSVVPAHAHSHPRSAARALGHAARYGSWRARQPGHVPEFADLRPDEAGALISGFLNVHPTGSG